MTATQKWLIISVVLLNAYSFGANCVERFVNYGSWPELEGADFARYHRAQQPYILAFVVAPLVMVLFLQVALACNLPVTVPAWTVITLIAASLFGFAVTALIQIPIHRQLDSGYSGMLVLKLLRTDWMRKAMDAIRIIAIVALLKSCMA